MPSLSPGTSGAKEAYGVSILREDKTIHIPPKAFLRYNLKERDVVLLTSTREGECGFAIISVEKAKDSVFKKIIDKIELIDKPILINSRPYALVQTKNMSVKFNDDIIKAFDLKIGEQFVVIKSTTMTMSYNPIKIFKGKLASHGFLEAVKNIDKLEIF